MIKKRYIVLLCVILLIILGSFVAFTKPALPFIQLPGEVYPGTQNLPVIGDIFGGLTNTFMASVVAYILILIMIFSLRAGSRTSEEVPSGFYNFFEMIIEAAYNFAQNIAGSKVRDFFPYFMSIVLIILVTNWTALIPGWDSIGLWEYKPHFLAERDAKALEAEAEALGHEVSHEEVEEFIHERTEFYDAANKGDLRVQPWLLRASANADPDAEIVELDHGEKVGYNPEAADWTIVPFFRPGATDLNYTLAFALIAMVMVQFYGFKYLGGRGYLSKFFPFIGKGFGAQVGKNPIKAIDPAVGLLELVSEISKIISFAFRLLGNIFAGMVLLFVMAFLLPVANMVFFGLELFVGLIQALVFGLLTLIFMASASTGHHGDEH
ncbi:MAG: F0F1 ATP synthase subunit A [Chloroflexi bacterium]|jgi:F-type H+-transporting ATPase subunit a|nr:F0F1 ATP synthase subunit A [Chloroflexota bacterium]